MPPHTSIPLSSVFESSSLGPSFDLRLPDKVPPSWLEFSSDLYQQARYLKEECTGAHRSDQAVPSDTAIAVMTFLHEAYPSGHAEDDCAAKFANRRDSEDIKLQRDMLNSSAFKEHEEGLTAVMTTNWPSGKVLVPVVDIGPLPRNEDVEGSKRFAGTLEGLIERQKGVTADVMGESAVTSGWKPSENAADYLRPGFGEEQWAADMTGSFENGFTTGSVAFGDLKPFWTALSMLEGKVSQPFAVSCTLPPGSIGDIPAASFDPNYTYRIDADSSGILSSSRKVPRSASDAVVAPRVSVTTGEHDQATKFMDVILEFGDPDDNHVEAGLPLTRVAVGRRNTGLGSVRAVTTAASLAWAYSLLLDPTANAGIDPYAARVVQRATKNQVMRQVYSSSSVKAASGIVDWEQSDNDDTIDDDPLAASTREALDILWPLDRNPMLSRSGETGSTQSHRKFADVFTRLMVATHPLRSAVDEVEGLSENAEYTGEPADAKEQEQILTNARETFEAAISELFADYSRVNCG